MQPRITFLLGLAVIFILSIVPPVSASYEVLQGDTIYLGETVDISRVMSWSGQFAYFSSGEFGDTPTKIVDVNKVGHMYTYYIDPTEYCVGTWYKWDGKGDAHGNMVAFYIAAGTRPQNVNIIKTNTSTIKTIQSDLTEPENPQDTHLLLARGDIGILRYHLSEDVENGANPQGYIWLFGDSPEYDTLHKNSGTFLGLPMDFEPNSSVNSITFTREMSGNLQDGWYSGYIQFAGLNKQQDVFYDAGKNTLDSPYKAVEPVNLDAFTPLRVEEEFIKLHQSAKYSDDILIPISVEVVEPTISIGDYWEESDSIMIRGSTPLSNGTVISVVIDPDQYALAQDIRLNTFNTTAQYRVLGGVSMRESECISMITELNEGGYNATMYNGTAFNQTYTYNLTYQNRTPLVNPMASKTRCTSVPRIFSIKIPVNWDDMAVGKHWIQASVTLNGVKTTMNKDFLISGTWVNPVPTAEFNKMIVMKQGQTPTIHNETLTTNASEINDAIPKNISSVVITDDPLNVVITPTPQTVKPAPTSTPVPVPTEKPVETSNPFMIVLAFIVVGIILLVAWLYWG